jgi:hypothetical protein
MALHPADRPPDILALRESLLGKMPPALASSQSHKRWPGQGMPSLGRADAILAATAVALLAVAFAASAGR